MEMLPESFDIEVKVDGNTFQGAYSVILGDLVVYYHGRTLSMRKPEADLQRHGEKMLVRLVQECYVDPEIVPRELPEDVRAAAIEYVNSHDNEDAIYTLVESIGESPTGSENHRRVAFLCLNALQPIAPCWKYLADDNAAERLHSELVAWVQDGSKVVDWEKACTPLVGIRDGDRIQDCDACRIEPIANSLAATANYLQTGSTDSAVEALLDAWGAANEGCWPEENGEFEQWLVSVALPRAYLCKPVDQ
jgi:hypothetical protein